MISTYLNESIEVLNSEGLKIIREELDTMDLITQEGEIEFAEWGGHKLEGYWYENTRKILKAIAPHVEGYAEFSYEEGYPFRIIFRDGNVYFKRGAFDWEEIEETKLI